MNNLASTINALSPYDSHDQVGPEPYVLLVQSDEALAIDVRKDLRDAGYVATIASNATIALRQIDERPPVLVVIDQSLSSDSGFNISVQIRRRGMQIPVLLMMNKDSVEDRVACLESGADDYFLKPYRTDDFIRLVQHYLRNDVTPQEILRFANLTLDLGLRQATRNGRNIELTTKEFDLLKYLMENARDVLKREQILENVWGYDFVGESNVIEVYIRYLRLKIEEEGEKRLIQTVRGVGYVLREL
jgi:two-component system, OmpR family, response regulator NblR